MSKIPRPINAEEAAGHLVRIRRVYRKLYRKVGEGDRSASLVRELTAARLALVDLLRRLDGQPRPTWTRLVEHYSQLEERLKDRAKGPS
jgi:hypothetical protein